LYLSSRGTERFYCRKLEESTFVKLEIDSRQRGGRDLYKKFVVDLEKWITLGWRISSVMNSEKKERMRLPGSSGNN
jgi:sporulation-control protein spo0M